MPLPFYYAITYFCLSSHSYQKHKESLNRVLIIYAIFFPFWCASYQSYKMDCCLTNTDAHVTSGSEDGFIFFWDLVDASVVSSFRAHASVVKYSSLSTALPSIMLYLLLILIHIYQWSLASPEGF